MRVRSAVRLLLLGVLAPAAALLASADAQTLLYTLDNPNPQGHGRFGNSVAVGDVNGDGKGDIVVGAPFEIVGGNASQGRAYVFSGADGSLLFALDTPNPQEGAVFGLSVAVGDVNSDGKGDIAVGAFYERVGGDVHQGRAYVFSGADGSLLFTLDTPHPQASAHFGNSLAVGDVNGDGKGDIAVGEPHSGVGGNTDQGRAYVFSGADGALLFTLDTPNPEAHADFGSSLAVADMDSDGKGDIAVGAPGQDVGTNNGQGRAYVFSGADGSLLLTLDGPNLVWGSAAGFGSSLAVGDVNGDGMAEIAVGAPNEFLGDGYGQGRAYVLSGADGSILSTLDAPNPWAGDYFGYSVAVGDVNGDGKGEIAVAAPFEHVGGISDQGRAYVFSGADGSLLFTLNTPNPQQSAWFGSYLAVADMNSDGKGEIAVGAPDENEGDNVYQGRAYVFSAPAATPTPTATPTPVPATPTPMPTHPVGVGGMVKLPPAAIAAESAAPADGSGWTVGAYAALGGMVVVIAVGGWYARRRWLR